MPAALHLQSLWSLGWSLERTKLVPGSSVVPLRFLVIARITCDVSSLTMLSTYIYLKFLAMLSFVVSIYEFLHCIS